MSSSYRDPERNACLAKAQLDSALEEPRLTPRTDIRTRRDARLLLPLCPLTRPQECSALLPAPVLLAPAPIHTFLLCFLLRYWSVFKSLHWELCFPLSTLIWLNRPPTHFASLANGRGEELNSPLSYCSCSLMNTPLTHTHTHFLATPLLKQPSGKPSFRLLTVKHKNTTTLKAGFAQQNAHPSDSWNQPCTLFCSLTPLC